MVNNGNIFSKTPSRFSTWLNPNIHTDILVSCRNIEVYMCNYMANSSELGQHLYYKNWPKFWISMEIFYSIFRPSGNSLYHFVWFFLKFIITSSKCNYDIYIWVETFRLNSIRLFLVTYYLKINYFNANYVSMPTNEYNLQNYFKIY